MLLTNPIVFKQLKEAISEYSGVGSTEYQLISTIEKITCISKHLQKNHKDNSAKKGLEKLVGRRNKLLKYLATKDIHSFEQLTKALQIRTKKGRPSKSESKEALSGYLWHKKMLSNLDKVDMSYGLWKWSQEDLENNEYQKLMIKTVDVDSLEEKNNPIWKNNSQIEVESSLGNIYYVNIHRRAFNDLVDRGKIKKAREQNTNYSLSIEDLSSDGLETHAESSYTSEEINHIIGLENLAPIRYLQSLIPCESLGCCVVIVDEGFNLGESFYRSSLDLAYEIDERSNISRLDVDSISTSVSLGTGDHGDRVAKIIHQFAPNSRFCLIGVNYSQRIDIIKIFSKIAPEIILWAKSRPVLMNISFGTNIGLHDGTHDLEDGIHQFLDTIPNSFAFKSVGNEGNQKIHNIVSFSYNKKDNDRLIFTAKHNILNIEETLIIIHTNNPIGYRLLWEDNSIEYYGRDKLYWKPKIFETLDGVKVVFNRLANCDSTQLFITFKDLEKLKNKDGIEFKLEFIDKAKSSSKRDRRKDFLIRAWIERTSTRSLTFNTYRTDGTITIPGSSDRIITVTAYDGNTVPQYCSRGPTYNNYKSEQPDLAAFDFSYHNNKISRGTSFAAPRILGCSALLLEIFQSKDLTISPDELVMLLIKCTTAKEWNKTQGYGFFDYSIFQQKVQERYR